MSFTLVDPMNPTNLEIAEAFSRAREELVTRGWVSGRTTNDGPKCAAGALAYVISGTTSQMYVVNDDHEEFVPGLGSPAVMSPTADTIDPYPGVYPIVDVLRKETGFPDQPAYYWNDTVAKKQGGAPTVLKKFDEIIEKYQALG